MLSCHRLIEEVINLNFKSTHLNLKSLTTAAGIALCATGLAVSNTNTVKADTINENYTVQSGDTLWTIAQRYQVDLNQLETINHKDANHTIIVPGEVLEIPTDNSNITKSSQIATNATTQTANTTTSQTTVAPVQSKNTTQTSSAQTAPTQTTTTQSASYTRPSSNSAKEWIAQHESGGSYSARNGQYVGRYQLSSAYLNGDYSPANQERIANKYVSQRYGSWANAKAFWQSHGWY